MYWLFYLKTFAIALILLLSTASLPAQSGHSALRQGDANYDRGDFLKAQTAYNKVPNFSGYYNAGNAAMQQGKLEIAVAYYQKALERSTSPAQTADALYNLGNAYLLQKKYLDAIKVYENSLQISPKRPDAKKNLQIARQQLQPPPPILPPPPPPPSTKPRRYYVDQAAKGRQKEIAPDKIPPHIARQMLSKAILAEEQKNAKIYRELSPSNKPSRLKKDW